MEMKTLGAHTHTDQVSAGELMEQDAGGHQGKAAHLQC